MTGQISLPVKVEIERRHVVSSGCVVTSNNDSTVTLTLSDLRFELAFQETGVQEQSLAFELLPDNKGLKLNLINFGKAQLGVSWDSIVGTLADRRLHLALYVISTGEPGWRRLVSYTFSTEGA